MALNSVKAYTLLEVLVVLIILVILSLIGLGFSSAFREKNQQQIILDEIKTAIHYARIQAVLYGHPLYLTPLNEHQDWSEGAMLYYLNNGAMETLYQWQWKHNNWHIAWSGVNSANTITFASNPSNAISNGKFIITQTRTQEQKILVLNRLGRVKVE